MKRIPYIFVIAIGMVACKQEKPQEQTASIEKPIVQDTLPIAPSVITDTTLHDTDDPAIWINRDDLSKSLIIGTDKDEDGALYVFDLNGKEVPGKSVHGLKRPNNVDIEYGFSFGGKSIDIAVVAERLTHKIRVFSLPDMQPIDNGGLEVYQGETGEEFRDLMGISCYKYPDGKIDVIVGRKNGPTDGTYLWQYRLSEKSGKLHAELVRKFGTYSGKNEIEAIAVDDELGYVYFSDEGVGIRKYYADPAKGNEELALFGTEGFKEDHEGISIFKKDATSGFIIVSDQQVNSFRIFPREGQGNNPHDHPHLHTAKVQANESDGSDVTEVALPGFETGLFVAMSDNKTFHFYHWKDIAGPLYKK
jgi:3-phytase